jgi:transposase-like protein
VDDLVQAMGGCHISKSEVSRICSELDAELALFRDRPLDDAAYPYVWFDATYEKVRQGGRSVSQAVAMAIRESGEKCVLGVAVGPARPRPSGGSSAAPWWPGDSPECYW